MTWRTPVIAVVVLVVFAWQRNNPKQEMMVEQEVVMEIPTSESPQVPAVASISTSSSNLASLSATPKESTDEADLTVTPTASPTARIVITTPTAKPQPEFTSEQIYGFTEKYGVLYAVDPNVLRHIALCESGFKPQSKNHIYGGLYQYDINTWQKYRIQMGLDADPDLRYHAEEAVRTTAYALNKGASKLWPNCYPK